MTVQLNRTRIFIVGFGIIMLFLLVNRVDYMINANTTKGKVLAIELEGAYETPIVAFMYEGSVHTFYAVSNMDVEPGDWVSVIYKISDPESAKIYSFVGFWLYPIIFSLIPIMVLIASVFSFFDSNGMYTVRIGKGIEISKQKGGRKVSLEDTSKTRISGK